MSTFCLPGATVSSFPLRKNYHRATSLPLFLLPFVIHCSLLVARLIGESTVRETAMSEPENTFSAPATSEYVYVAFCSYSPLVVWLLLVAPLTTLSCLLLLCLDDDSPPAERELSIKILIGTTLGILILYLFILPFRVSVKSDGTICLRVLACKYSFPGTVRAYHSPGIWDDSFRKRIKFSTHQDKRVVIIRRGWDLTVSPSNPQEFVDAVSNTMSALEAQGGVS